MRSWLAALLLLAVFASNASAEGPVLLPHPNLQLRSNGVVLATARAPDGAMFVGGAFSTIAGVPRQNIAKLKADGSVDPDWNPGANDRVTALAVGAGGSVYAGGYFRTAGGLVRHSLAKFDAAGAGDVDVEWDPQSSGFIFAIAIDAQGAIFVGGVFQTFGPGGFPSIGGQPRNYVAKLSPDGAGSAAPDWNPNPHHEVDSIVVAGDSLFIGATSGLFQIGGVSRAIVKLDSGGTGQFDADWNPANVNSAVSMAGDGHGHLYVTTLSPHMSILKLSVDGVGAPDADWSPPFQDFATYRAVAVSADGSVYSEMVAVVNGTLVNRLLRMSDSGTLDSSWSVDLNGTSSNASVLVSTIGFGPDSEVIVGGHFRSVAGAPRAGLALLSHEGLPLTPTDTELPGTVLAMTPTADGGWLVGRLFDRNDHEPHLNLLRVKANGAVDADWHPDPDDAVFAIAVDAQSNVYIGGDFQNAGGKPRYGLARLSPTAPGAADASWVADTNARVQALAVEQTSQALFAGGFFTSIGDLDRTGIAKIGSDGQLDSTWNANVSGSGGFVFSIVPDDASIYVGGQFVSIGGLAISNLARVASSGTGSVDATWTPASGPVNAMALAADGNAYVGSNTLRRYSRAGAGDVDASWQPAVAFGDTLAIDQASDAIYVGGYLIDADVSEQYNLAKVSLAGTGVVDAGWQPGPTGAIAVVKIANDRLYVGGTFDMISGQARSGFAVFGPDEIFSDSFE